MYTEIMWFDCWCLLVWFFLLPGIIPQRPQPGESSFNPSFSSGLGSALTNGVAMPRVGRKGPVDFT